MDWEDVQARGYMEDVEIDAQQPPRREGSRRVSESTSNPVVLWRQQVDERIWFEAIENDWGKAGRFVFLYCRAKLPDRTLEYRQVYPADEWAQLYKSDAFLRSEKERILYHIRYALADADAPEIQQELTVALKAIILRMFLDDSIHFQERSLQELRQFGSPMQDIEHRIWEDARIPPEEQATWTAFCLPHRLTIDEMKLFKRIADEARNWFTWNTQVATYQFLPMPAWYKVHREWRQNYRGPEYWNFK